MAQHKRFAATMKTAGGTVTVIPVPLGHREINIQSGTTSSEIFKTILALAKGSDANSGR
jgi:hypothetical protein